MKAKSDQWLRQTVGGTVYDQAGNAIDEEEGEDVTGGAPGGEVDDREEEEGEMDDNMDALVSKPLSLEGIEQAVHRASLKYDIPPAASISQSGGSEGFMASPEQCSVNLESSDEFILIATSSLFSKLSNQQACDFIHARLRESNSNVEAATKALIEHASEGANDVAVGAAIVLL
jgi:serine/threonine protein phosphatase PrpC